MRSLNGAADLSPVLLAGGSISAAVTFPGSRPWHRAALECRGGLFVSIRVAGDEHYAEAAEVAARRIRRCLPGSDTYWWYRAVMAEHGRRQERRPALFVVGGGSS